MSETQRPETDGKYPDSLETSAKIAELNDSGFCDESNALQFAHFARRLERERDEARRLAEEWRPQGMASKWQFPWEQPAEQEGK